MNGFFSDLCSFFNCSIFHNRGINSVLHATGTLLALGNLKKIYIYNSTSIRKDDVMNRTEGTKLKYTRHQIDIMTDFHIRESYDTCWPPHFSQSSST